MHANPAAIATYGVAAAAAAGLGRESMAAVGPLPLPAPMPAGLLIAALSAVAVAMLVCHGHRQVVRLGARPVWWARSLWLAVVLVAGYAPLMACPTQPEHLARNYLIFTGLALFGSVVGGTVAAAVPVAGYLLAAALFGQGQAPGGQLAIRGWAVVLDQSAEAGLPAAAITGALAVVAFAVVGAYTARPWPD